MQNVHLQNRIINKTWSSDFKCRILSSNVEFFWINHTLEAILVIHHLPIFNQYTLKIFNYFISKYFFHVFFTSNTIHLRQKNQYGEEGRGKQSLRPIISFKSFYFSDLIFTHELIKNRYLQLVARHLNRLVVVDP